MVSEGKLSQSEATEIGNRTDVLSYALLAEINTFHNCRVRDIRDAHKHFLQEQISHYQKVKEHITNYDYPLKCFYSLFIIFIIYYSHISFYLSDN